MPSEEIQSPDFIRHIRVFTPRSKNTAKRLRDKRGEMLAELVESEVWDAVKLEAEEACTGWAKQLPTSTEHLIGFFVSAIVEQVKNQILNSIEMRARAARARSLED